MIKFDNASGKKLLVMRKVDLPEPKNYDRNILSDIKQSYENYCSLEGTIIDDLQYLVDSIHNHFNNDETDIRLEVTDIKTDPYSAGTDIYAAASRVYRVNGYIYSNVPGRDQSPIKGPIELFRIPYMDSRGVLTIDTSTKTLVNSLQASEGVSYSRKDREINIQLGSRNLKVSIEKSGKFTLSTSKKKRKFIDDILYGCFAMEKYSAMEAFKEYSILHNSAILRSSVVNSNYEPTSGLSAAKDPLSDLYTKPAYKLNKKARHELNKACQLDRALGETLSRDVMYGNITLVRRGTIITKEVLKELKSHHITTIYVRHMPMLAGLSPSNIPPVTIIANGTRINNYVRSMLNGSYGYFVTEDIHLNLSAEDLEKGAAATLFTTPGMLGVKGKLQTEHVEALYNVYTGLENAADNILKKSTTTSQEDSLVELYRRSVCDAIRVQRVHSKISIPLDVEITTNGTFWGPDIGMVEEAWFVLDENNKLIKQEDDKREFTFQPGNNLVVTPFDGTYLNRYDIMALYSMIGWYALEPESRILHDRDEMLLKKVKTVNDIFSECFRRAVDQLLKVPQLSSIRNYVRNGKYATEQFYCVREMLIKNFHSQLIKNKLVQTADTKNPAATLSQVSNITTVVQSSKAVSDDQRLLSFAYASRICPYETPASGRIGLVNHKAMGCRINSEGLLTAYYRRIDKTQHRVTNEVVQMTAAEACKYNIADLLRLDYIDESKGTFRDTPVTAMVPNESKRGEAIVVETISSYEVDYVFATAEATISATAMLIPFLGADDTARISFGLSMQKQAINCLENERPRVMTSMYMDILDYNNYYAIHAEHDGVVVSIDDSNITVNYRDNTEAEPFVTDSMYKTDKVIDLVHRTYEAGKKIISDYYANEADGLRLIAPYPCIVDKLIDVPDRPGYSRLYIVPNIPGPINKFYSKSLIEDAGLQVGDEVQANVPIISQELVEGHGLVFRKQLYYIQYDCIISEIVPSDDKHVRIKYTPKDRRVVTKKEIPCHAVEINQSDCVFMRYDKAVGESFKKGDVLAHASVIKDGVYSPARNAIVCYIPTGYNYEDAIDMSQDCARHYTAVAAHKQRVSAQSSKDFESVNMGYISEGTPIYTGESSRHNKAHNVSGYYLNRLRAQSSSDGKRSYADARLLAFNNHHEGDKMAGRHGNKGVTARVCPNSKMPMFLNGRIPDICLNPCGVPSRMNIGQNLEAHLGFIATMLDVYVVSDPFNGASKEDIATLMEYVWKLANADDTNQYDAITAEYRLPASLANHAKKNFDYINSWKGCFNPDGTAPMWDPVSQRMFDKSIAFGVAYFLKLEQEADEKIHARAGMDTSAYVDSTQQPSHSRAKGGGQRNGEMELVTLGAYGAVETLHEAMHEKSDNVGARYRMSRQMFGDTDVKVSDREDVPQANDMLRYLLEAIGVYTDISQVTKKEARYLKPIDKHTSESRRIYNHSDVTAKKGTTDAQLLDVVEQSIDDFVSSDLLALFGDGSASEGNN